MSKHKPINIDSTQKGIKDYFSVSKEPLKIKSKAILTSAENYQLLRSYRSKNRKCTKKAINDEICDNDVMYVETEKQDDIIKHECNIDPCSPKIVLDTGFSCVYYASMNESDMIENVSQSNVCTVSPSKRQRIEADSTKLLTITKSKIPEVQKKASRTFQMSQTSDPIKNESSLFKEHNLAETENINKFLEVYLLEERESLGTVLQEQNDNLNENRDNPDKITSHVSLVDDILSDILDSHLSTLLFDDEISLLRTFQGLTVKHKYLGCKLFTHQIKWYNAYKFAKNIKLLVSLFEIKQMIVCLKENRIIRLDYSSESTVDLLNQLVANDVKAIHDTLRLKSKQKKKPLLIDNILNYIKSQTTLHPTISSDERVRKMIFNKLEDVVQINPLFYTAFYKAHLLYMYTNPEFDIPSGLYHRLHNIRSGGILHPPLICQDCIIFRNAQEFADFYKAFSYKSEVLEALNKKGETKFTAMFGLSGEIVKEFNNVLDN
ncbi:hypothetical protein AMK59_2332 [Oryctes borbonicus]|uniref:Fanconi-associated nuclease n=1 Tax=Oryctes borbonicus TaxID=1629725 RepID=A0A0T6BEU2_9SCAR|nr:hypothetical protein AMK59_2332 [Oryctes borbonicus]